MFGHCFWYASLCVLSIDEKESVGCFTLIAPDVFDCKCFVALHHGVTD